MVGEGLEVFLGTTRKVDLEGNTYLTDNRCWVLNPTFAGMATIGMATSYVDGE